MVKYFVNWKLELQLLMSDSTKFGRNIQQVCYKQFVYYRHPFKLQR